ncbi:hypothetical protein C8Q80DRAFT_1078136, partial [Daedaleopsis nitida]
LLVWIKNAPSPQEICDRIMDQNSDFQKAMVEYLESVHQGEFAGGDIDNISKQCEKAKADQPACICPTETLPNIPPYKCQDHCDSPNTDCAKCKEYTAWLKHYATEVDELLYKSNRHRCKQRGCKDPRTGTCKARFSRDVHAETKVDPETGALILKKGEAWLNTFTPAVTYMMCCNHNTTSLLSGTAIKSVIAYVADYITKTPLETHVMFQAMQRV